MKTSSPQVALLPLKTYAQEYLDDTVNQLLAVTCGDGSFAGSQVLIKPNLICAQNGALACSEPALLASVARWFLDRSATVKLGDSPAFGSARAVLEAIGAFSDLSKLGVDIIEFNQTENVALPDGRTLRVATAPRECDILVNVPRVKAHGQARVTMAVKNMFGCVAGLRKAWWHMAYGGKKGSFSELILQLLPVFSHSIALLDGIKAMHVTGPIHGKPFGVGVLGCSANAVALDSAFLDILGIAPADCPLWVAAARREYAGVLLKQIEWTFLQSNAFNVNGFIVPEKLMPIRFNPFRFIKNSVRRIALPLLQR